MTEKQCQLQPQALIHSIQYCITIGFRDTAMIICVHIPPLVGHRGTAIFVKEIFAC